MLAPGFRIHHPLTAPVQCASLLLWRSGMYQSAAVQPSPEGPRRGSTKALLPAPLGGLDETTTSSQRPPLVALRRARRDHCGRRTREVAGGQHHVWLMNDAQSSWPGCCRRREPPVPAAAPRRGRQGRVPDLGRAPARSSTPRLAGGNAPDVKELGNTETVEVHGRRRARRHHGAEGRASPTRATWLQGLAESGDVQRQALRRARTTPARAAVIYRVDQYRQAGDHDARAEDARPSSWPNGRKLMQKFGKDRSYSALYFPGKNWYASHVLRLRLRRPDRALPQQPLGGRAELAAGDRGPDQAEVGRAGSCPGRTRPVDEANPPQALVFSKGKVGSFIGNGWEWGVRARPEGRQPGARRARSAPTRCRATLRASTCRRSSAARTWSSRRRARTRRSRPTGSRRSRARRR